MTSYFRSLTAHHKSCPILQERREEGANTPARFARNQEAVHQGIAHDLCMPHSPILESDLHD